MTKFTKNKQEKNIIITIKRLGINGEGIGYYKKKIIFIPGALPNEVVVAKIVDRHPHYLDLIAAGICCLLGGTVFERSLESR